MGDAPVAADAPSEKPDEAPKQLAEVLNEEEGEEEALAFADRSVNARSKRLNKAFFEKRTEVRSAQRVVLSFLSFWHSFMPCNPQSLVHVPAPQVLNRLKDHVNLIVENASLSKPERLAKLEALNMVRAP